MRLCFSFEDIAVVHLAPVRGMNRQRTLCGRRAFAASLDRRKITCDECKKLKPRVMGGK